MGASADKKSPLPKQRVMLSHAITPVLKAGSFLNTTPTQHPHGSLSVSSQTMTKDKLEFPIQPFLWDRRMWQWTWCLLYYLQSSCLHRAPSNAKPRRGLCLYTCPCLAPTQKALQDPPPHYSPRFAAPMTLLGIFKGASLTLRHCRFFFRPAKLCSIYRIRASSNARETGQMSLHRCISLLLTFTLPFPFTNSAGREREQRFKGRQYRSIFNHLL